MFVGAGLDNGKRSGRTSAMELFPMQVPHPNTALVTGASRPHLDVRTATPGPDGTSGDFFRDGEPLPGPAL